MSLTDLDCFGTYESDPLSRSQGQRRVLSISKNFRHSKIHPNASSSFHKCNFTRLGNWLYNKSDLLSWKLLWRRQGSTNFKHWAVNSQCEELAVLWAITGTYGSSLAMFAAFFGLYKCDKIRRFNRMKYIHRILVR